MNHETIEALERYNEQFESVLKVLESDGKLIITLKSQIDLLDKQITTVRNYALDIEIRVERRLRKLEESVNTLTSSYPHEDKDISLFGPNKDEL